MGTTTFLGRPAYTVELAPPAHKPFPIQLVIDSETGLVLQQRNDGFGSVDEWVELVVGEQLDESAVPLAGPVPVGGGRAGRARAGVAGRPGRPGGLVPRPRRHRCRCAWNWSSGVHVHVHEPDGSFQASIGEGGLGMLARRPSSAADWQLGWAQVQHRWSADGWDWALSMHGDQLTEAGLAALKRALASA